MGVSQEGVVDRDDPGKQILEAVRGLAIGDMLIKGEAKVRGFGIMVGNDPEVMAAAREIMQADQPDAF
jgi:hypothetical protein